MGRKKLKIQKLETSSARQVTFSKRKTGIMKKLRELSILCSCDAILLLFSTSGKPTLCLGQNSTLEGVIKRYAEVCPQERLKKKLECLEALKKTFRGTDHTVDIEQLMNQIQTKPAEDLKKQIKMYQDQIAETLTYLGPLGDLDDIDNIESIDKIIALEKSLNALLGETKIQKDYVEMMCTNQGMGMNQGLALQLSNIAGPSSQPLVSPLIVSPSNTGFSNFDVPTGGVQFNGTEQGENDKFVMTALDDSVLNDLLTSLDDSLQNVQNELMTPLDDYSDYVEMMCTNQGMGMNQGLALQLSNIAGPNSQPLVSPLIVSPSNTGFSNFDVPTGGVQFNGTEQGENDKFVMTALDDSVLNDLLTSLDDSLQNVQNELMTPLDDYSVFNDLIY